MDRKVFITEDGDQRIYELRSGEGAFGVMANESEYVVLDFVATHDGILMSEVLKVFQNSRYKNMDHWIPVFDAVERSGYITFQNVDRDTFLV